MSTAGVAVMVFRSSNSVLQAHAGSRAAGPAASKAAVLVSSTFVDTHRTHNVPTQPAMWQDARLLLSRTVAAKPPALQVRHACKVNAVTSAVSHQHNSPLQLSHLRHAWAAAVSATCRTHCGLDSGAAAQQTGCTIACSAAWMYVGCMLTWPWQAATAASAAARRAMEHAGAAGHPAPSHTHTAVRRRQCCQRHRYSSAVLTELAKQHRARRPHAAACKALHLLGMLLALIQSFSLPQFSHAQSYSAFPAPPNSFYPQWHLEDSVTYASKTGNTTAVHVPHLEWEIRCAATLRGKSG